MRLFGWVWPKRGGLDGRRELARVCQKKVFARMPSDYANHYPGMAEDDLGTVLWMDKHLTTRGDLESLAKYVGSQAKAFFKVAKPVLHKLARG